MRRMSRDDVYGGAKIITGNGYRPKYGKIFTPARQRAGMAAVARAIGGCRKPNLYPHPGQSAPASRSPGGRRTRRTGHPGHQPTPSGCSLAWPWLGSAGWPGSAVKHPNAGGRGSHALLPAAAGTPRAPVQPGHQLVAVPAVARLRPFDRGAGRVEGVPGQQQQRHADVNPQQRGVPGVGEPGFDRLLRLGDLDAVVGGERLVQRRVAVQVAAQARETLRGQVREVHRHRLPVGQPEPVDTQHPAAGPDAEQPGELVVGGDVAGVQDHRLRVQPLGPHPLGVAGQLQHLGDLGHGHERALALHPQQPPLDDELGQRLPHGGPRRPVPEGELTLGRDRGARCHRPGQLEQLPLHRVVLRDPRTQLAGHERAAVRVAASRGGDHCHILPAGDAVRT